MGVQRTPRFGAESEMFDLTKTQLSSKLSPKEFAWNIREWMGTARWKERPIHHNTKGNSTERAGLTPLYIHTEKCGLIIIFFL